MDVPAMLPWFAVIAATCVAAVIDARTRRLPNLLTGPFLLAGLVLAATGAPGFGTGLGGALLGAAVVGLPFLLLWMIGGGGAGDAKMMMGVGAWLGPSAGLIALAGVALAGGVLVVVVAISRGRLGATLMSLPRVAMALPLLLAGSRQGADQSQVLAALVESSAAAPDDNAAANRGTAAGSGTIRVAYGPAIFVGCCAAAVWIWWNS